jgi:hypothetical protein
MADRGPLRAILVLRIGNPSIQDFGLLNHR